jgi:hypothetical protein
MIQLSEQNVADYLRASGRAGNDGQLLVQSLSGGVANTVLKCFDTAAGDRVGSDIRTPDQVSLGNPDTRPHQGACFVLKQPLPRFKTQAEWLVDIDRVLVERDALELLATLLPAGSVPRVLWFDDANHILALSCAPPDAVIWKKALLEGHASTDAATHAGMLLAMMHSSTHNDPALLTRYGNPKFFTQQRIDPYLHYTASRHPVAASTLVRLAETLLKQQFCLIHGDYSPKNIFLIPSSPEPAPATPSLARSVDSNTISQLLLLDLEVAFFGHPAFDVATLLNHFLLKGFHHHSKWRPFMLLADHFWQTYRHTATKPLVRATEALGGHLLGALMLARVDGKSPVEYLDEATRTQVRNAGLALLTQRDSSLESALDAVSTYFDPPA